MTGSPVMWVSCGACGGCVLAEGDPLWAQETWWRDSNPRTLLCRQLPGLLGTPRANDTRVRQVGVAKLVSKTVVGLRRVSARYGVVSPRYAKVALHCFR